MEPTRANDGRHSPYVQPGQPLPAGGGQAATPRRSRYPGERTAFVFGMLAGAPGMAAMASLALVMFGDLGGFLFMMAAVVIHTIRWVLLALTIVAIVLGARFFRASTPGARLGRMGMFLPIPTILVLIFVFATF